MRHKMRRSGVFLLLFFYISAICVGIITATELQQKNEQKLCKSIEINHRKDLEELRNCTVIVGHVRLINMAILANTTVPESNIEEITDYLMVYRVHGLNTLQRIFPKLKLIRGNDLLFNKYSLVVLENRELENLGLISLLRIQKGNVRVENNPVLCFVDTINWIYIVGNKTQQDLSLIKNKPSRQCPVCRTTSADNDTVNYGFLRTHCWNLDNYQRNTIFGSLNCSSRCGIYGCNDDGVCCSPYCLTGCSAQNCEFCAVFNHTSGCRDTCPLFYFQHNKRECVSQTNCLVRAMIPYSGVCLNSCPPHYIRGNNTCIKLCSGNLVVQYLKDLEALVGCESIRGSLTIELLETNAKVISSLEHALGEIREITKYLKIKNSPQLVSLQFMRSLHTIQGIELIDEKYALYVVNNHHLEQIWNRNQNVAIIRGRIYFHLNPRLCYEKILQLSPSIKQRKIDVSDVSPNSNGERVVCGENVRTLNATVEDFNSTAVRIKVEPLSAEDLDLLIGYAHYWKEAPERNVTWYDGRHGCGHDDWNMDISINRYMRHVMRNLKPFTQYAYFVKTLTMTDYHIQLDAYSNIQYFTTMPSKPGPVAKVYYHTLSTTELMMHWWPPFSPNGEIAYYLVNQKVNKTSNETDLSNIFRTDLSEKMPNDICKCQMNEPFKSGPLPSDENFYSKEQITYDEALANFIYVKQVQKRSTNESENAQQSNFKAESQIKEENNATKLNREEEAERRFRQLLMDQAKRAFDLQNTNLTEFEIVKPLPLCPANNISSSCRVIEHFEGVRVPANIHHYVLNGLSPDFTYNISVRACLENGECGAETTILAKTISKALEDIIHSAQNLSNDIDE